MLSTSLWPAEIRPAQDNVQIQYVDLQFADIDMTFLDLSRLLETVSEERLGLRYFRPPV